MDRQEKIKQLWQSCFHDDEEFIRLYFNSKYRDQHSMLYEENGNPLSAFLMLPYLIKWHGTYLNSSYISGACTDEKARNRGLMKDLLKKGFQKMYENGITVSTLIPAEEWLFNFYRQSGYATTFDSYIETVKSSTLSQTNIQVSSFNEFSPNMAAQAYPWFDRRYQQYTCAILHTKEDYLTNIEDCYHSGGRLAIAFAPDCITPCGWGLAIPQGQDIRVKECVYESMEIRNALLKCFSDLWPSEYLKCRIAAPVAGKSIQIYKYGMARIIHVSDMLQQVAAVMPEMSLTLEVEDDILPQNTGCYSIYQGKCIKNSSSVITTDIRTDIPTLTQAVFGYHPETLPPPLSQLFAPQNPYMNLMLD